MSSYGLPPVLHRGMPCAPEMEMALIGMCLADPKNIDRAKDTFPIEAMHIPEHRQLLELLLTRRAEKKPTDMVSISQFLLESKQLNQVGGAVKLAECYSAGMYPAWDLYEAGVVARWQAREIIQASTDLVSAAFNDPESIPEQISSILPRLQLCAKGKSVMRPVREILLDASDRWQESRQGGQMRGITTGFKRLDKMTGGFLPGEFVVICGETKSGKTALAIQMACATAKNGLGAGVFSLEMSDGELIDRMVSSESGIDSLKFRTGEFDSGDWLRLTDTMGTMCPWPMWITHSIGSLAGIQSECRKMKGKLRLVIVDYIQLVETTVRRDESREQQVAGISRSLKAISTECGITVIGLSQVNEQGKLRESRAIGQDANLVLAVEKGEDATERNLRIVVQRSGPAGGIVPLTFKGEYVRFE